MEGWDEGEFVDLDTFLPERNVTDITKHDEKVISNYKHVKEAVSTNSSCSCTLTHVLLETIKP